jgi:hypothetical protein
MRRILISFGGSNRSNRRCIDAFIKLKIGFSTAGPATLGSKRQLGIVNDTPDAREAVKRFGGSVCRRQWEWLNRDEDEPQKEVQLCLQPD